MAVQRKVDQPVFVTPEEYLAFERASLERHEYRLGEIVAMSGATEAHNTINMNLSGLVWSGLRGGSCRAYANDMKVRITGSRQYCYPDLVAVCGEREFEDERQDILRNPTLIVEVLSESTEAYDRGEKFLLYQRIPSLREYVLVSQARHAVERFVRDDGEETWRYAAAVGEEESVTLESVGVTLRLADLYEGVEVPGRAAAEGRAAAGE